MPDSTLPPPPMADLTIPAARSAAIVAAGQLGVFHALAKAPSTPAQLATVFDLPVPLEEADRTIAEEQIGGRVTVQAGDYLADDIGDGWDGVLCFNLIHNHQVEENRQLIARVAKALRPGGMVVVQDYLRTEPPDVFHAAFSLVMFAENGTRTYGYDELASWLAEAGFQELQRVDLAPGPSSLVTAVRGATAAAGAS